MSHLIIEVCAAGAALIRCSVTHLAWQLRVNKVCKTAEKRKDQNVAAMLREVRPAELGPLRWWRRTSGMDKDRVPDERPAGKE